MPSHPSFYFTQRAPMCPDLVHKVSGAFLAFQTNVPVEARARLLEGCPEPIAGCHAWGDRLLSVETGSDALEWELCATYGTKAEQSNDIPEVTDGILRHFSWDVERWVVGVHQQRPLLFAIGPGAPAEDAWEEESQRALPALLVDFVTDFAARNRLHSTGDGEALSEEISGMHLACLLQYLPKRLPKSLAAKATDLRKRFHV